jgi:hypothetical protein
MTACIAARLSGVAYGKAHQAQRGTIYCCASVAEWYEFGVPGYREIVQFRNSPLGMHKRIVLIVWCRSDLQPFLKSCTKLSCRSRSGKIDCEVWRLPPTHGVSFYAHATQPCNAWCCSQQH